ncbi:hypothetical protein Taro_036925 [Colocasia esculenta]|uniref:Uncharacterized protein n=1 Tax=Colocasia esculenta TaxID=4460 RepID=A0A843VYZ4_COLES|nr:hypothetical protein [Colocasia esculenta]
MEHVSVVVCVLPRVVVRRLFRNASLVGYPMFFVSQARVFVVLGVYPDTVWYRRAGLRVRGYETERLFLYCVVRVGYWPDQPVVRFRVVASFLSDSCFATGSCGVLEWWHSFGYGWYLYPVWVMVCGGVTRVVRLGGPPDWAQSAHRFSACERDRGVRRILNATGLVVAFLLPLLGGHCLHGCRVSHARQSAFQGELLRGSFGRFEVLVEYSVRSRREDVVWSGGNAEGSSIFAFFVKCGTVEVCVVFLDTLTPVFELEVGPESLKVTGMGLQCVRLQSRFDPFEVCPGVGTVVTAVVACGVPEWWHNFGYGWYLYPVWVMVCGVLLPTYLRLTCESYSLDCGLPVRPEA